MLNTQYLNTNGLWSFLVNFKDAKWDNKINASCVRTDKEVTFTVKCKYKQEILEIQKLEYYYPIYIEDGAQCGCKALLTFKNYKYSVGLMTAIFGEKERIHMETFFPQLNDKLISYKFRTKIAGGNVAKLRLWIQVFTNEKEKIRWMNEGFNSNIDCDCQICPAIKFYKMGGMRHVRNRERLELGKEVDTSVDHDTQICNILPPNINLDYPKSYSVPLFNDVYTPPLLQEKEHNGTQYTSSSTPPYPNNHFISSDCEYNDNYSIILPINNNNNNNSNVNDYSQTNTTRVHEPTLDIQNILKIIDDFQAHINLQIDEMRDKIKYYLRHHTFQNNQPNNMYKVNSNEYVYRQ